MVWQARRGSSVASLHGLGSDGSFIATRVGGSRFRYSVLGEEPYMPGATTVGIVCKDGVMLASERRYAYGTFVMSKSAKKIFRITDTVGVACAGIVGDMQVLSREALAYMNIYRYERGRQATVKNAAKLMVNLLSGRRMMPYLAQTIIAGVDDGKPDLYVLDPIGSVLSDKFAAVGTGAEVAMGVLEAEYKEGMSVEEARPVIVRALKSALARDISSGDGMDLMIITHDGIKEESETLA
jgi:proteasome beta subunit